MKGIKISILIFLLLIFHNLNRFINFPEPSVEAIYALGALLLYAIIVALAFRNSVLTKRSDFQYFTVSYGIILLFLTFTMARKIAFNDIFAENYITMLGYIDMTILFFGIFIIKENISLKIEKQDIIIMAVVNIVALLVFVRFKKIEMIIFIVYLMILYFYNRIYDSLLKRSFVKIILYRLLAKTFLIGRLEFYKGSEYSYLTYFIYAFYILSLVELALYFNKSLNKNEFSSLYLSEKRIDKLLKSINTGVIVLSGNFIRKINREAINIIGLKDGTDIVGKNIFLIFDNLKYRQFEPNEERFSDIILKMGRYDKGVEEIKARYFTMTIDGRVETIIILENPFSLNSMFKELNDSTDAIVSVYDEIGCTYINPAVEKVLKYTQEEFYSDANLNCNLIDKRDYEKYVKSVKFMEEKSNEIIRYTTKSGEVKWLCEMISSLNVGSRNYRYGVSIDVTDIKERELLIEKENKELEEQIHKKEMGMSIVSHELRTPITAIIGFLENIIINKDGVDKKIIEMVYKVYNNGIRLNELVNNLLDFNKLNAGKLEAYKEKMDLNSIIKEVKLNNEMLMEIREIECSMELENDLHIYADATMVFQIMNNLISNAIKYNRDKGNISIRSYRSDGLVKMEIVDSGVGIESKNIDKIFKEYERISGTRQLGTGLGLPLVKHLVEINGGKIEVASEFGKGSTFRVSFLEK